MCRRRKGSLNGILGLLMKRFTGHMMEFRLHSAVSEVALDVLFCFSSVPMPIRALSMGNKSVGRMGRAEAGLAPCPGTGQCTMDMEDAPPIK